LLARSCGIARLVYNTFFQQRSLAYGLTGRSPGWAAQADVMVLALDRRSSKLKATVAIAHTQQHRGVPARGAEQ
jgi:hypothetical protein